jgi:hypothetical protein
MMPSRSSPVNILVAGKDSLLEEGISRLLNLDTKLKVSRIVYTDDETLYALVSFYRPEVIFISEFNKRETDRIIRLVFSMTSVFVRRVIVAHLENNIFDIYNRPVLNVSITNYEWQAVAVKSKDDLVTLAYPPSVI